MQKCTESQCHIIWYTDQTTTEGTQCIVTAGVRMLPRRHSGCAYVTGPSQRVSACYHAVTADVRMLPGRYSGCMDVTMPLQRVSVCYRAITAGVCMPLRYRATKDGVRKLLCQYSGSR